MKRVLLVYDEKCIYCRSFTRVIHWLDRKKGFKILAYDSPEVLELLQAQFGLHHGFAMFLFEDKCVSWGAKAAQRVAELVVLPCWIRLLALHLYPSFVRLVSKLTHRTREVCGPECAISAKRSSKYPSRLALTFSFFPFVATSRAS